MEKILEHKFLIGVVLFTLLLVYVGGLMTRGMNNYNSTNTNIELLSR